MDVDRFVIEHSAEWARLDKLAGERRLNAAEAEELVSLYQRCATHLSILQSSYPDPALVARLSQSLAVARSAVLAGRTTGEFGRFFLETFPVAAFRARWWWLAIGLASIAVATVVATWIASNPALTAAMATPEDIRQLVDADFADYYRENPAGSFAARIWTNNAWVAALSLIGGALACIPALYILWQNALNVGLVAGLMASVGRLDLFFGLVTPHGLLELTAVFLAAGAGIRLGWQLFSPGPRPRSVALATEGRAAASIAMGLVPVLLISGIVEAFVTPSPLPTWARIAVGVVVWLAFLTYVVVLGRRGVARGRVGDVVGAGSETELLPYAA